MEIMHFLDWHIQLWNAMNVAVMNLMLFSLRWSTTVMAGQTV
jgi:hypothetical protein